MENIDVVCPDPDFKLFVRERFDRIQKCLNNKVSWAMSGVVVAIFSAIAFLVFTAYSNGQEEQCEDIKENSAQVQELKTLKNAQEIQTKAILLKLEELTKQRGGD
jgi:predicted negative regulator of RcsB-dependent stress response